MAPQPNVRSLFPFCSPRGGRAGLLGAVLLAACAPGVAPEDAGSRRVAEPTAEAAESEYLADLAFRYLYEEGPDDVTFATLEEVENLTVPEARVFLQRVQAIEPEQAFTSAQDQWVQERIRERLLDHAEATGTRLGDLSWKDVEEVEDQLIAEIPDEVAEVDYEGSGAWCLPGYAICSTVSFTTTLYGASCASGCTRASGYDRASNSGCELGACDYRVEFPTGSMAGTVDGVTAAADCVILYYGGFIARSSSGRTQVGYGLAGPTSCWTTGGTVSGYMQVR